MYACIVFVWYLPKSEEGTEYPGTVAVDRCGLLESNLGPLEEHSVLLVSKHPSSLHSFPPLFFLKSEGSGSVVSQWLRTGKGTDFGFQSPCQTVHYYL